MTDELLVPPVTCFGCGKIVEFADADRIEDEVYICNECEDPLTCENCDAALTTLIERLTGLCSSCRR